MSDTGRRVALLARPGVARDCVRGALLEIGADIVAEDDPGSASPEAIRAASPDVLMIILDAVSETTLDRFDSMLGDPAFEVMFEEADVAAARDGWEAARWRRHLAAKLNHRDDVLPPILGAESAPATDELAEQLEELISVDAEGELLPPSVPDNATAGQGFSIFDPVAAEGGDASMDYSLTVHGLELDTAANDTLPQVTGPDFSASDFDPLLAELDAELPDVALAETPTLPEPDWQGGLIDGFAPLDAEPVDHAPVPAAPVNEPSSAFGELTLSDDIAPVAARVATGRTHDLDELERRISTLALVGDAPPAAVPPPLPPASAPPPLPAETVPGAVLVLAGIGGPDAVRQLLGSLPARFGRPVLLRQRLDGARYDKLVAQLQRASTMPVALAQPGAALQPGHVYVLGDEIGLSEDASHFVGGGGDRLIEQLPATESAVIVLSGADASLADPIAALAARGAYVGAQSPENCYDAVAANAVASRGATSAPPSELAAHLAGRWGR
ncbi:chemotaxis protein CheB [Cognatilysobacter lacus]|uniref:protein-glutamate methylesterase n=1 Tax=Cognatilysobacter lacus TaxID=1643323 RepID=A0A5D8Z679_9GAMM|nr:chemotaxis protein CheB [Lysobacter lacus]TZF90026.1 hypothetical protein FW784_06915 [Lysobacter lacus]